MKVERRQKTVIENVYIASDGKEFTTQSACEDHEKYLNDTKKKCTRCGGTGRINGRYEKVFDHLLTFREEDVYTSDPCPECHGKGYFEKVTEWR